uniref:Uncharacterized protein n=1 Tax=Otus sunia TaxID=257818 RepID=A0A8C8A9D8_9STRI
MGLRVSPRGSGRPHGAQGIPTAPRTHSNTCNTEPASGLKASHLEKLLPVPTVLGRQQRSVMVPAVHFHFYRKKLLLDPGLRFLATSHLSPPFPLNFLQFSAKPLNSSRFLKRHIFLL